MALDIIQLGLSINVAQICEKFLLKICITGLGVRNEGSGLVRHSFIQNVQLDLDIEQLDPSLGLMEVFSL